MAARYGDIVRTSRSSACPEVASDPTLPSSSVRGRLRLLPPRLECFTEALVKLSTVSESVTVLQGGEGGGKEGGKGEVGGDHGIGRYGDGQAGNGGAGGGTARGETGG